MLKDYICTIKIFYASIIVIFELQTPLPVSPKLYKIVGSDGLISDDCLMPSRNFWFYVNIYHNYASGKIMP